jgi:SLT domain-containing protein
VPAGPWRVRAIEPHRHHYDRIRQAAPHYVRARLRRSIGPYGDHVPGEELLTTSELARALGLSLRSVQRYIRAGYITPELTTPGGHHRWRLDDVREQLRQLRSSE